MNGNFLGKQKRLKLVDKKRGTLNTTIETVAKVYFENSVRRMIIMNTLVLYPQGILILCTAQLMLVMFD